MMPGLWECKARSNPCDQDWGVLTPKSYHAGKQKKQGCKYIYE